MLVGGVPCREAGMRCKRRRGALASRSHRIPPPPHITRFSIFLFDATSGARLDIGLPAGWLAAWERHEEGGGKGREEVCGQMSNAAAVGAIRKYPDRTMSADAKPSRPIRTAKPG